MKKHTLFFCTIAASMMLFGCGSTIPDMTDAETAVVMEYATNLLVKYSTLSDRALLNEAELEEGIAKEAEEQERLLKVKELENMYLNGTDETTLEKEDNAPASNSDTSAGSTVETPQLSISEFFAEDSFIIEYASYILCQSYPEESEEELFIVMDATAGKQLCIVKFNVNNLTSEDQMLDMYAKQGSFSLKLDDRSSVSAESTLLMNDLSSYAGTIRAGGSEEMVLVFEVPDSISQINSMQLLMSSQTGKNTLTLQ